MQLKATRFFTILFCSLRLFGCSGQFPADSDARDFLTTLVVVPRKKYVTIARGTHVMHLEKVRFDLYRAVRLFLNEPEQEGVVKW